MPLEDSNPFHTDRTVNVTAKQVRAFLAAVEHKNFSEAARRVFQSQSAFSRCIQELELALGEEVFARLKHGITLTEFGAVFLPHAQRLMETYAEAQSGMAKWRDSRQGKLTLAGASAVMHVVLPTLMRKLRAEFGQTSIVLQDGSSAKAVNSVLAGSSTIGVCTLISDEPDLHCTHLLEAPIGLLVAPGRAIPIDIRELAALKDLPFMRFDDDAVISRLLRANGIPLEPYFNSPVQTCNLSGSFALVREDNMVMLATGFGATHPEARDLRFVPLPGLLPSVQVSIISRRGNAFDRLQQVMLNIVKDSILDTKWHASVHRITAL